MTKVFGIGMMKTGTSTLATCMEILGYRHAPYSPKLYRQIKQGDYGQIAEAIEQYDSFDDWPWPAIYTWIDEKYPDSKFILTMRKDEQTWFNSIDKHAKRRGPTIERKLAFGYAMPSEHNKKEHIARYVAHNQGIMEYFKDRPDKLLVVCWEAGTCWQDLGAFLDIETVETALPRANTSHGRNTNWKRWGRNLIKYLLLYPKNYKSF